MRILHTADWHIGKVLHKHSLSAEIEQFLSWLLDLIQERNIDVLLVSGDIFDVANPSVKDRELYYNFLSKLIGIDVKVIITGGNHDSVGLLNAPQEILRSIDVHVIGGAKEDLRDELIEVKNKEGEIRAIIAAVPFLRDRDLRNLNTDQTFGSRSEALKFGIAHHYSELAKIIEEDYSDIPAVAMGHLFAHGVSVSESERDIHIGNSAAVESNVFPDRFGYVALGHIHRPQIINKNLHIRYSGSPIALSFSEKADEKCVLLVELKDGEFSIPEVIPIPKYRELRKITGSLSRVASSLLEYAPEFLLKSFVEIEVLEEEFSAVILAEVEALITKYNNHSDFVILKSKTTFARGAKDTADLFYKGENIEDLKPVEVFGKLIDTEVENVDQHDLLIEAFLELLEEVQSGEGQ